MRSILLGGGLARWILVALVLLVAASATPQVLALFTDTQSVGANTLSADTLLPPTSPGASATASDSISVSWTATASTYAAGYTLRRSKKPGLGYSVAASLPGRTTTSYGDTGLQPGTSYYYVADAYYQNWTSVLSNEVSATTPGLADVGLLGSWLTGLTHTAEPGSDRGLVFVAGNEQRQEVLRLGAWGTGLTGASVAGSDRLLVFIAGNEHGDPAATLSSVTYGGQAMTKVNEISVGTPTSAYVTIWILKEAGLAAASNNTFVATWSANPSNPMYAHAIYGGVDQTTSTGAQATASTAASTPNPITTAALATATGDLVVTAAVAGNNGTYTPQNGFTLGVNQNANTTTTLGTAAKTAAAASETPSMSHSNPNRQVIAGVVLKKSANAPAVSLTSVSYGGQQLTKVNEVTVAATANAHVTIWFLNAAGIAAASNGTFVPTWTGTPSFPMYAHAFYKGVDQTTPTGAQATASTAASTPNPITTAALATATGDLVVTAAVGGNNGSYTPQNGFTLGVNQNAGATTTLGTAAKTAAAATETPSMSHSNPNRQVIAGVVLNRRRSGEANAWTTGLTHTVGAGSNRLLVFVAGMENGAAGMSAPAGNRNLTSVSYGGQPMTEAEEAFVCSGSPNSFCARTELWYLPEAGIQAATGSTFSVGWSGDAPFQLEEYYAAITLTGVNQVNPIGNTSTNATTTLNPIQVSNPLGVGSGDVVIASAAAGNSGTYAPGTGYTETTDQTAASSTMATARRLITSDGTQQPSMQFGATMNRQTILAVAVKAAGQP